MILFTLLVLFEFGCQTKQPEDFLNVITDPSELEKARTLAASNSLEPLSAAWLSSLNVYSQDNLPSDIPPEIMKDRLESIIGDRNADMHARSNAAFLFTFLDPPAGQKRILSLLNEFDAIAKRDLLFSLGFVRNQDLAIDDPMLISTLFSLFGNRKAVWSAIQVCGGWNLPGSSAAMWKILPTAEDDIKAELLFWLSRLEPERKTFNACVAEFGKLKDRSRSRCLSSIGSFISGKDPVLVQNACEFIAQEINSLYDSSRSGIFDIPQSESAEVLQNGNGQLTRTLAANILENSSDSYLKCSAYTAFRRWEGKEALVRLVKDLDRPGEFQFALDAISNLYTGSENADLVAALSQSALNHTDVETLVNFARTLIAVGGDNARAPAGEIAERLPEKEKKDLFAELNPCSAYTISQDLVECGILKGIDPGDFVESCKETYPEDYPAGSKNEPDLLGLLNHAGILLWFDVETGEIPVRHDRLILDFSGITRGAFQPEACHERMLQQNPDDYEASYEVQFISTGKLYRFIAMNFDDWYDLKRVIFACRKAVADSGEKRTFYQVATGDQTAIILFLLPEQAKLLTEKYFLTYEDDPESPMRQGKEYEDRVRKELR